MRIFWLLFILIQFNHVVAQTLNDNQQESLASFSSPLIDYEIYNDEPVALIKKNKEFFIYYTDAKGAKLFDLIEISEPAFIELDCMGNLFVVGSDSAIQIHIGASLSIVQSLSLRSYNLDVRTCEAYFEGHIVRGYAGNLLVFEPTDDSIYRLNPVSNSIQFTPNEFVTTTEKQISAQNTPRQQLEQRNESFMRDSSFVSKPMNAQNRTEDSHTSHTKYSSELSDYKKGDSLWVIDHNKAVLMFYSNAGILNASIPIGVNLEGVEFEQDRISGEIYAMSRYGRSTIIKKLSANGELLDVGEFYKGLKRWQLNIHNGYLYFRDSKGMGESIKRVPLN